MLKDQSDMEEHRWASEPKTHIYSWYAVCTDVICFALMAIDTDELYVQVVRMSAYSEQFSGSH